MNMKKQKNLITLAASLAAIMLSGCYPWEGAVIAKSEYPMARGTARWFHTERSWATVAANNLVTGEATCYNAESSANSSLAYINLEDFSLDLEMYSGVAKPTHKKDCAFIAVAQEIKKELGECQPQQKETEHWVGQSEYLNDQPYRIQQVVMTAACLCYHETREFDGSLASTTLQAGTIEECGPLYKKDPAKLKQVFDRVKKALF